VRVRLDVAKCTGHGRCYMLGPDVYGEDDAGRCVLRVTEVPPELEDQAHAGEQNCPEGALEIIESA
jgi:ferredoxin